MAEAPPDYYEVLGVSPTAPPEIIVAAHRARMKKLHPDVSDDDTTAEAQRVNEAFNVLNDETARARYDADLRHAAKQQTSHEPPPPDPTHRPPSDDGFMDPQPLHRPAAWTPPKKHGTPKIRSLTRALLVAVAVAVAFIVGDAAVAAYLEPPVDPEILLGAIIAISVGGFYLAYKFESDDSPERPFTFVHLIVPVGIGAIWYFKPLGEYDAIYPLLGIGAHSLLGGIDIFNLYQVDSRNRKVLPRKTLKANRYFGEQIGNVAEVTIEEELAPLAGIPGFTFIRLPERLGFTHIVIANRHAVAILPVSTPDGTVAVEFSGTTARARTANTILPLAQNVDLDHTVWEGTSVQPEVCLAMFGQPVNASSSNDNVFFAQYGELAQTLYERMVPDGKNRIVVDHSAIVRTLIATS